MVMERAFFHNFFSFQELIKSALSCHFGIREKKRQEKQAEDHNFLYRNMLHHASFFSPIKYSISV
jgi:hypothetical protein